MNRRKRKNQNGFSLVNTLAALVIVSIISGFAVPSIKGYMRSIQLRNAANSAKYFILNARSRAVSNPMLHCGVVFTVSSTNADSIFAFIDNFNPTANVYDKGKDSLYKTPIEFLRKDSVNIISATSSTLIFRGDGSANTSTKVVLKLYNLQDTLDVLASTGRVKVLK